MVEEAVANVRTVITYGTFDLFHDGHRRLLERARALGDRLIVGVTTDTYDRSRGKLNVVQSVLERIENVRQSGLADQIEVEEYDGQKIHDIQKWGVDVFAIGSDWLGKFDYLRDYCEVVYLDRTRGVSSTQLRNDSSGIMRLGLVGAGPKAESLVVEARYVSGISVEAVWDPNAEDARALAERMELARVEDSYSELLKRVDAVFISTSAGTRAELIRLALGAGVNVLSEPPLSLTEADAVELVDLAREKKLALVDGIRTAYSPGFLRMVAYARSGSIGRIRSVEATMTRLSHSGPARDAADGGAIAELAAYPLLAVIKLLGTDYDDLTCQMLKPEGSPVDLFARIDLRYKEAIASVKVGIGVRAEGDLEVAGSNGSLYVPAPWWRTQHFETRFEDPQENQGFFVRYEGEGIRYELAELASRVRGSTKRSYKLRNADSISVARIIERARGEGVIFG